MLRFSAIIVAPSEDIALVGFGGNCCVFSKLFRLQEKYDFRVLVTFRKRFVATWRLSARVERFGRSTICAFIQLQCAFLPNEQAKIKRVLVFLK